MEELVKYAIIFAIAAVVLNILVKILIYFKRVFHDKYEEYKMRQHAKAYIKKKNSEEKPKTNKYFGLLEFLLENSDDEESLKKDYCSIIKDKIKSKYKNIFSQFSATDKIFFSSGDFSMIDDVVNDLIKLYKFFADINTKRNITTKLKFSLWAKPGNISTQTAYKVLDELNNLNYVNQVIASDEVYKEYQKHNTNGFNFNSHGIIKLNDDEDLEIYRLIKNN